MDAELFTSCLSPLSQIMTLDCIELKFISHLPPLGMLFNSCVISRDGIEDGGDCGGGGWGGDSAGKQCKALYVACDRACSRTF